jgi:hypothetical protein
MNPKGAIQPQNQPILLSHLLYTWADFRQFLVAGQT